MLYAIKTSGADAVLALGGVQGLAAMAFGLIDGLEPVDMLVGAGNAFVAEAKRQLFGRVGIDLLAGPTEVLVIADETADPRLVATDLLGQAEHGPTSPAGCIAIGESGRPGGRRRRRRAAADLADGGRRRPAWRDHGWIAIAADDDEAVAIADDAAYEHLEVQVARGQARLVSGAAEQTTARCSSATRRPSPTATRPSAPTTCCRPSRAARYTGGLWVGKFLKTCTYQRLTAEGTRASRRPWRRSPTPSTSRATP